MVQRRGIERNFFSTQHYDHCHVYIKKKKKNRKSFFSPGYNYLVYSLLLDNIEDTKHKL